MAALQFSYTLSEQQAYDGLRLSGTNRLTGKRAVVESVLLGVFFVFFLASYIAGRKGFDLGMTIVSGLVLVALVLLPRLDMRRRAKQGQREVTVRLSPQKLTVGTLAGDRSVSLEKAAFRVVGKPGKGSGQLLTGSLEEGGLLIVPVDAIPKEIRGKVLSTLLSGKG